MREGVRRIRIVVGDRELELEGDEAFVETYRVAIDELLGSLKSDAPRRRDDAVRHRGAGSSTDMPVGEFGEQLAVLPRSATATDQILLAGHFAQRGSADNTFATKDASALLLEQSVKIGNPSQCVTNNLNAKRLFKVGGRYRVSRAGEEHLASLLGS